MLKGMSRDYMGVLSEQEFIEAVIRALTEEIIMNQNWFPIQLLNS
jgi:hypothetical protein